MTDGLDHEWKAAGLSTPLGISQGGKLLGVQLQPRDIAAQMFQAGWRDADDLSDAVKVCLSESQGYDRAFNDNADANGKVTSRDVGIMQINIPASLIGTPSEEILYNVTANLKRAWGLWRMRGFQPWVAYTTNVFLRDTYLKRANRGLANWLADRDLHRAPTDTLAGTPYAHTLTTPVFDFEYRLNGTVASLVEIDKVAQHAGVDPTTVAVKKLAQAGLAAAKS